MHHSIGEASEVKAPVTHLTCQIIKSFRAIQILGMPGIVRSFLGRFPDIANTDIA